MDPFWLARRVFLMGMLGALALAAPALPDGLYAQITTPRGEVVCELFFTKAPLTVTSFVGLAEGTLGPMPRKPFYDGLTFHRVAPDFVVQGGDPAGTGEGGPGYGFADEFVPGLRHDAAGVLSMANEGPDTNGSQFFITLRETNRLNYLHSVFGRVVRGLGVLPQIKAGDTFKVRILRQGSVANAFRADEAAFQALARKTRKFASVVTAKTEPAADAHFHDPDALLPTEPPRARYFNFKLANVERATGLRIVGRMSAKSPSAAEDAEPGAFMRRLAAKVGTMERGAVMAYFADEDDWRVWIGDASAAAFVGRPGTAQEFSASGALHDTKEIFFPAAMATGDADYKRQQETSRDNPPPPAQRVKLRMDAVLDGLIQKLYP